jgi:glycosyltransferase involved in cell wall biosynthesis
MEPNRQSNKRHCMVVLARYPLGETRVQREAEALIDHGYEVDVICQRMSGEAAVDYHRGVRIYREKFHFPVRLAKRGGLIDTFLIYLRFIVSAAIRLTRLHRQRPYHTIQVHNLPDFLIFCALVPKLGGVPIILDLHDLMPEFYAGRFGQDGNSPLTRLVRWQERLACGFADHIITVSEHWRQVLIERGVPAHKSSVVMNVADHTIFHQHEELKTEPCDKDGLRLIYHGNLTYRYGIDLALRAVAKVRQQIPDIHLTIHGSGDYYSSLVALAKELNLSDQHVHFSTEFVSTVDLPNLIRSADIGLAPYRTDVFTDGIVPTKLMEYAALGMPAIAARTTAIEAYFKGTMVELFAPGDANDLARCILTLHSDRKRLAQLTQGVDKFNQRYNWTKIGADYVALVERLGSR